ncbi:MAG: YtxH domain-containing protein [Cyclobacteriaceae bacterium]
MNRNSGNTMLAFLIGAAAGGLAGVLFAPDKGSNTRDRLSYRLHTYRKTLEDLLDDLVTEKNGAFSEAKTHGEKVVNDAREKAERLLEDVDELLNHINKKSDS